MSSTAVNQNVNYGKTYLITDIIMLSDLLLILCTYLRFICEHLLQRIMEFKYGRINILGRIAIASSLWHLHWGIRDNITHIYVPEITLIKII